MGWECSLEDFTGIPWKYQSGLDWSSFQTLRDTTKKHTCVSVGLEEDALNQARWREGVGEIAVRVG